MRGSRPRWPTPGATPSCRSGSAGSASFEASRCTTADTASTTPTRSGRCRATGGSRSRSAALRRPARTRRGSRRRAARAPARVGRRRRRGARALRAMDDGLPALVREAAAVSQEDAAAADGSPTSATASPSTSASRSRGRASTGVVGADGGTSAVSPTRWTATGRSCSIRGRSKRARLGGVRARVRRRRAYPEVLEEVATPFAVEPRGGAGR